MTAGNQAVLMRPPFHLSDLWKAPLHDFPVRDELLFQYLPLAADMSVLEVGPGAGYTPYRYGRVLRRITLLDIAEANIEQLRRSLGHYPNIQFVAEDVCAPGLAGRLATTFDAIYGIEVFACVPDPAACLKNLAAVLNPGGRMLLQWPNYERHLRWGPVTSFHSRKEVDGMLRDAGFREWQLYALKLRPYADFIYSYFHERPLRMYRKWADAKQGATPKTLVYDQTWAFQNRRRLERYRMAIHTYWTVLSGLMRLGGDAFARTPLADDILNRNLLLVATK